MVVWCRRYVIDKRDNIPIYLLVIVCSYCKLHSCVDSHYSSSMMVYGLDVSGFCGATILANRGLREQHGRLRTSVLGLN